MSIVLNLGAIRPVSLSVLDRDAVRRIDALQNRLFLDALFRGQYPDDLLADVFGDAVAFAYTPAPPDDPKGERALFLVHPRKPETLAKLVERPSHRRRRRNGI